ncbi:UDP-glucose 4-epimerase [Rubripirellula tenax]|uniref:UDP-glucose 4-epimerase n=1 Tax=Rubripirellula tenax TaxID=2528015 RepID=A0A5C6FCF8_9BACT|nr:UDP-glucose 4-epimerase GalE [Rubripirellula tenax]TWU59138.1 UDP-glucose 4-epimerase [Rubripirellula tenax]
MNVLVVGGAGYIGSHAVRTLMDAGHTVTVYDNLSRGHAGAVPPGMLVQGDLADQAKLVSTLKGKKIDAVMHFAAFALVNESVNDPSLYYRNNVIAALELLDAMREADVKKIVFSSTTATYGEPEIVPIPETTPQHPINPYGFTKLVIEQALADYAAAYGFAYAALRYFNAAGARPDGTIGEDHTPESHLIPIVLQVALGQREAITIYGDDYPTPDGTCIRDYIHIDDLGAAHLAAMERLEAGKGLCVNLGTGKGTSVREIIDACREVTGHAIPEIMGTRRAGDPPELVADARLAKKLLGWEPKYTDVKSIIETAWRWHQSHPKGYASASV